MGQKTYIPYKTRIIVTFVSMFFLFAGTVTVYQYQREKETKILSIENTLCQYSDIIFNHLNKNNDYTYVDSLVELFPVENLRVTVIDLSGKVLFDNAVRDVKELDNHGSRPEILSAKSNTKGYNIRKSATTGKEYFYFAKNYENLFVRSSLIYNIPVINQLKVDTLFILITAIIFIVFLIIALFVADKLGDSILVLKNFAINAKNNKEQQSTIIDKLPNDELGVIAQEIITLYSDINKAKNILSIEREKLNNHFQYSSKGIAIFNEKRENIFVNPLFIQYINIILTKSNVVSEDIFKSKIFKGVIGFVDKKLTDNSKGKIYNYNENIEGNGKYFEINASVFFDKSFEISIADITKDEKRRILKHEITGNIAHELKTPVTIVKGYLETITENKDLESEQSDYFLSRSIEQINRLVDIINEISIISKLEEAPNHYEIEELNLNEILNNIKIYLGVKLDKKNIILHINLFEGVIITGNKTLIHSIFQNLIDNSIKYAGENTTIEINTYLEDDTHYYFSYRDNGPGIPEEHIQRIFERFYRVSKGRSRSTGGSGLGLSIVKNAVQFHKGVINAKIHKNGGLEFVFSLGKKSDRVNKL